MKSSFFSKKAKNYECNTTGYNKWMQTNKQLLVQQYAEFKKFKHYISLYISYYYKPSNTQELEEGIINKDTNE